MNVIIYHPETQGEVAVPEESVHHYRASGWVLRSEWNETLALREKAAKAAAKAAASPVKRPGVKE